MALVAVQLIANLAACQFFSRHNGRSLVEEAEVVSDVVVDAGARRTVGVAVRIVRLEVNDSQVVVVTDEACALAVGHVEVALVENKIVCEVSTLCVRPCSDATELVRVRGVDVDLCEAVLNDRALVTLAGNGGCTGIRQCGGSSDGNVCPAVTDNTAGVVGDGGSVLLCGCEGTLHLQSLDDGVAS